MGAPIWPLLICPIPEEAALRWRPPSSTAVQQASISLLGLGRAARGEKLAVGRVKRTHSRLRGTMVLVH